MTMGHERVRNPRRRAGASLVLLAMRAGSSSHRSGREALSGDSTELPGELAALCRSNKTSLPIGNMAIIRSRSRQIPIWQTKLRLRPAFPTLAVSSSTAAPTTTWRSPEGSLETPGIRQQALPVPKRSSLC